MSRFIIALLLVLSFAQVAKAENSATIYNDNYRAQQVFVSANAYAAVGENDVVILDVTNGTVAAGTLGSKINTTTTSDSVYVFGVADEAIATGSMGRICVRGPHRVNWINDTCTSGADCPAAGVRVGASTTAGEAGTYSTADGTVGGVLGYVLSATRDTSDTDSVWIWVDPGTHK